MTGFGIGNIVKKERSTAQPGRPKDPEKHVAILVAARELFLEMGFDRASMDKIAARAGVSKLTLYSHFQDKDSLFKQVISAKCQEHTSHELFMSVREKPVAAGLLHIITQLCQLILSEEALSLHRVMTAEAATKPRIAKLFYDTGPCVVLDELKDYLEYQTSKGALAIPDCTIAARQLVAVLKGELHMLAVLNLIPIPDQDAIAKHAAQTVDFFMKAYGVPADIASD